MTRAADLAKLIAGSSTLGGTGELVLKDVDTADGSSPKITFQTGDTDIAQDDVLGTIDFQAPDEGTGTDAILVSAGVEAKAEGDFSSSSNATSLTFKTGSSAAASERVRVNSSGNMGVGTTSPTDTNSFSRALDVNGSSGAAVYTRTNGSATNRTVFANSGTDGYIFNGGAGTLRFYTNATQHMNISSAGNVTIDDGNLVLADGHGINFAATTDASGMASELFDNYEEGTFTSSFGGSGGNQTISYSFQFGTYVLVGKICQVTISVGASNTPSGGGGDLIITGLPFTSKSGIQQAGSVAFTNIITTTSGTTQMGCNIEGGVAYLNVNEHEYSGASGMNRVAASGIHASNPRIVCSICYEIA